MKRMLLAATLFLAHTCCGQAGKEYTSLAEALAHPDSVYRLDLSNSGLNRVPPEISRLQQLRTLVLDNNNITGLGGVRFPEQLEGLTLRKNRITAIAANVVFPRSLSYLYLSDNRMTRFEPSGMDSIETLEIDNNQLTGLPEDIGRFQQLLELKIEHNRIRTLPAGIGRCERLWRLYADYNQIAELPPAIVSLKHLDHLYVGHNKLKKLPEGLEQLTRLSILNAGNNNISTVPVIFSNMSQLIILNLSDNKITTINNDVFRARDEVSFRNNKIRSVRNISPHPEFKGNLLMDGTELNAAGRAYLQRMLPNGKIYYSGTAYGEAVGHPVAPE